MSHPALPELRAALARERRRAPAGSWWEHAKSGGVYRVVLVSLRESDHEPLVTYRGGGVVWTRTAAEFVERFEGRRGV